jgi:hypothetical protein
MTNVTPQSSNSVRAPQAPVQNPPPVRPTQANNQPTVVLQRGTPEYAAFLKDVAELRVTANDRTKAAAFCAKAKTPVQLARWYVTVENNARAFDAKWGKTCSSQTFSVQHPKLQNGQLKEFLTDTIDFIADMPLASFSPESRARIQKLLPANTPDLCAAASDERTLREICPRNSRDLLERYLGDLKRDTPVLYYGLLAGCVALMAYLSGSEGLSKLEIPTDVQFKVFNDKLKVKLEGEFATQFKDPRIRASGKYDLTRALELSTGVKASQNGVESFYVAGRVHGQRGSVNTRYDGGNGDPTVTVDARTRVVGDLSVGGGSTVALSDPAGQSRYFAYVELANLFNTGIVATARYDRGVANTSDTTTITLERNVGDNTSFSVEAKNDTVTGWEASGRINHRF